MESQSKSAKKIAQWLEINPKIAKVFYPELQSNPQYKIANAQQSSGGAIVSFELIDKKANSKNSSAWNVINNVKIFSKSVIFGDSRSIITHPYTTT